MAPRSPTARDQRHWRVAHRPLGAWDLSKMRTDTPVAASRAAQAKPETPAPITATRMDIVSWTEGCLGW